MFVLTNDQAAAADAVTEWANLPADQTASFFLDGNAGTGKTFLISHLAEQFIGDRYVVALAPTHKAVRVLATKLAAAGIPVTELEKSKQGPRTGVVFCGTHSSFLGITPVIVEEQKEERVFGKGGQGKASQFEMFPGSTKPPTLVFMDECSMLGKKDLVHFKEAARDYGLRFLFCGDMGQLPPVKAQPAPFHLAAHKYTLTEPVRQGADSEILTLAQEVRDDGPYQSKLIPGVWEKDVQVYASSSDAARGAFIHNFLDRVEAPTGKPEEERTVFLAYTNAVVDHMNEMACEKVYGHGMHEFRAGERVVAVKPVLGPYDPQKGFRTIIAQTNEELDIHSFDKGHDTVYCEEIGERFEAHVVGVKHKGRVIYFHYLPESVVADKNHPYRVELAERLRMANELQGEYNKLKKEVEARLLEEFGGKGREFYNAMRKEMDQHWMLDKDRRRSWARFFEWKEATLAQVRHLFAYTTHKSQGSTFDEVFVDYQNIQKYARNAVKNSLYVAITRPRNVVHMLV